jgi:flagellar FliJ protein
MLNTKRLQPIQQLNEQRQDAAATALADAQRLLATREAQLRELENYREPSTPVTNVEQLRNREAFRLKIAEAIGQQKRAIEQARKLVEQQRQRWMASRQQTRLYDKLAETAAASEQQTLERRAQKELDELALRQRDDSGNQS